VVLVHRPGWNDWSFPKGKLDPGEPAVAGAVREVVEETGLAVRVGPRLPDQQYLVNGGTPTCRRTRPTRRSTTSGGNGCRRRASG
jgi:8-oxo-dGTP pyrophosphatase MutT (NUDIX family)